MDGHVRISGSWKRLRKMHVRVSGSWKEVNKAYVRVSGSWKQFFTRALLAAGNGVGVAEFDAISPYGTTVGIRFLANGTVQTGKSIDNAAIVWSAAGVWISPTDAASEVDASVRYTNRVGTKDFTSKAANQGTWIQITSTRTWTWHSTTFETDSFTTDFQVRDNGGALATATQNYSFAIDNSA